MRHLLMVGLVLGISGSAAAAELSSGGRTSMLDMGAAALGGAQRLGGTEIQFSPPYAPSAVGQSPWMMSTDDVEKGWRERVKTRPAPGAAVETTGTGEGEVETYPDERPYDSGERLREEAPSQPPNDEGAY